MIVQEILGVPHVIDSVFYPVRRNSRVSLTVEVGDFQAGGTSYSWKGVVTTGQPNFTDHKINPPKSRIGGTTMHCMTKVMDIVDYRVSSALWITGTFGRNYDDNARGSLLAQLGLSLNLSKERYAFPPSGP
ncbi:MAG TPA: hypothetical protein VFU03_01245 [Gemmatimonadales bacterium]|nr:hypothetical protein [Gemmatimonadales bacterium]